MGLAILGLAIKEVVLFSEVNTELLLSRSVSFVGSMSFSRRVLLRGSTLYQHTLFCTVTGMNQKNLRCTVMDVNG